GNQAKRRQRDQSSSGAREKGGAAHGEQREEDRSEDRDRPAQWMIEEQKIRGSDGEAGREKDERVTAAPGQRVGKHVNTLVLFVRSDPAAALRSFLAALRRGVAQRSRGFF